MGLITQLSSRWEGIETPFLIHADGNTLSFTDMHAQKDTVGIDDINPGEVVALIGDFCPRSIAMFLRLIDRSVILVPLTVATRSEHPYFFESALVDVVIEGETIVRLKHHRRHTLIDHLRHQGHAGLILFSTGTTSQPKPILHDFTHFLKRFNTPRPALRTLSFLLFDHIGGINTLLHTLFNRGTIVIPSSRHVDNVLRACMKYGVELLPTTPTFLRMMLMSNLIPEAISPSLKVITYGTERMDQPTLDALCELLPRIDFRQTFGMSELGIFRVKSDARNSLFMKIGGEDTQTRVVDGVLEILSETRMLGYLHAPSPFDVEGWYNTKDIVVEREGSYKITGRISDVINVGGLKFMASDVEQVSLKHQGIALVAVEAKTNPITGQHVELIVQPKEGVSLNKNDIKAFLSERLQPHMIPQRIKIEKIPIGHRFKKG